MQRIAGRIGRVAITFGGIAFWSLTFLGLIGFLGLKGCESACYREDVLRIPSPSGEQVAVVELGDCGGATTDFWGTVNVESDDPRLTAENLYGFQGRPHETGLTLEWLSDTELVISIDSLGKARRFHPNGRASADLKVEYRFRNDDET